MIKEINPNECVKRDILDSEIQKLCYIYDSASCNDVDGLILNIREIQAELKNLEKEISVKNIVCRRRY